MFLHKCISYIYTHSVGCGLDILAKPISLYPYLSWLSLELRTWIRNLLLHTSVPCINGSFSVSSVLH